MNINELLDAASRYVNNGCPPTSEQCKALQCPFAGLDCTDELVTNLYHALKEKNSKSCDLPLRLMLSVAEAKGLIASQLGTEKVLEKLDSCLKAMEDIC